ncbi:MAG: hypothetical protein ACN4GZ_12950 [Acidimicrobiales bacterium]
MSTELTSGPHAIESEPAAPTVSPSEAIWQLIDHPFRPVDAARAMFGLSPAAARHVVARDLLTSDQTLRLLEASPDLIRHMTNRLNFHEIRAVGAVLGPIQWHSTIMARAAAGFPDDLFICETPYRDFDVPENQLFKFALKHLVDSGRFLTAFARGSFDDDRIALARDRSRQAKSYLELRPFDGVKPLHDPAIVRRANRGKHSSLYRPVLDFIPQSVRPLNQWTLTHLGDRRTSQQHKMILAVLATLRREGVDVRPLEAREGVLTAGPMEYRHPGARGLPGAHGIRIGDVLLDVADVPGDPDGATRRLGQRSGSLTPYIVESVQDVSSLVDRIVEAAEAGLPAP